MSDRLALRRELRRELWRRGDQANYLLDTSGPTGGQQAWVRMLEATPPGGWAALEVSRQRGKTFSVLVWMFGRLGLKRGHRGVFLAQTGENAYKIVQTFVEEISDDLPPEWRVRFVDGEVRFANGSEVAVFGTDNQQFRRSRGRNAHIVVLSEAGFYSDLPAVEQVYVPQLQTTGGVGVYESSPAETPAHEFSARCDALKAVGRYVNDTFWSNPRIDHEAVIKGECERRGLTREELLASSEFQREFGARRIIETNRAALPSWDEAAQRECVLEVARPPHFDAYVSFDWGWQPDPSSGLWGWYDVASSRIVVEAEREWRAKTLSEIAADAKAVEMELYGANRFDGTLLGAKDFLERHVPDAWLAKCISDKAPRQPYLRVGDNDVQLLAEMSGPHGYAIMPTDKADKHLQVDNLNMLIRQRRLIVHPRCKRLLAQMSGTLWNKARTEWERTSLDHGEGVDCFVRGTKVRTPSGETGVEWIRAGDVVETRSGPRRVERAGRTRKAPIWRLTLEDGRVLEGTASHPVMTQHGWRELQHLTDDCMVTAWNHQSTSSGADSGGSDNPAPSTSNTASTTSAQSGSRSGTFMSRFGSQCMELCRAAIASIIMTATRSTTTFQTCGASPAVSTPAFTPTSQLGLISFETWPSRRPNARLQSGTGPRPAEPGTLSIQRRSGETPSSWIARALSVALRFGPRRRPPRHADLTASRKGGVNQASTTSPSSALNAGRSSRRTSTPQRELALVRVASVHPTGREDFVFNLSVCGEPEYFANGVLVHNCLVYLGRNVRWHRDCRPVPPRDVFVGAQVQSQKSKGLAALASGLTGRRF